MYSERSKVYQEAIISNNLPAPLANSISRLLLVMGVSKALEENAEKPNTMSKGIKAHFSLEDFGFPYCQDYFDVIFYYFF